MDNPYNIAAGDQVRITGGGPLMTVLEIDEKGTCRVQWQEGVIVFRAYIPLSAPLWPDLPDFIRGR